MKWTDPVIASSVHDSLLRLLYPTVGYCILCVLVLTPRDVTTLAFLSHCCPAPLREVSCLRCAYVLQ